MTRADPTADNEPSPGLDELKRQLASPEIAAQLSDIFSKLDVIQLSLGAVDGVLRRGDAITDEVRDGLAEARETVAPSTVLALGRLVALTPTLVNGLERLAPALESEALDRLGNPEFLSSLANLSQHTPLLTLAAEAAAGFLERSDVLVDNLSESIQEARGAVVSGSSGAVALLTQLSRLLPTVQRLLQQIDPLIESRSLEHLAESKILAPEMVETVAKVGDALHATRISHLADPQEVGIFGMMKALRDPDAKRGLGFMVTFLKEFGRQMR